jgi:hypothetical protein
MIFNFTERKKCIEFADYMPTIADVMTIILECGEKFLVKVKETEIVFDRQDWENVECVAITFCGEVCKEVVR